jgi:hypothetical protein
MFVRRCLLLRALQSNGGGHLWHRSLPHEASRSAAFSTAKGVSKIDGLAVVRKGKRWVLQVRGLTQAVSMFRHKCAGLSLPSARCSFPTRLGNMLHLLRAFLLRTRCALAMQLRHVSGKLTQRLLE